MHTVQTVEWKPPMVLRWVLNAVKADFGWNKLQDVNNEKIKYTHHIPINTDSYSVQSHMRIYVLNWDFIKPGFHIIVSKGDASQSVDRRCCWEAYDDMGTFFWWCRRRPHSIADVPVEIRKVQLSSTFDNVPDASPSCPRRCWDVPVVYDDAGTPKQNKIEISQH